ncbi:Glucanosyltransferase [Lutibacter oricola]|uniref:Endo-1,3-beta-glucanase btgC n=1 Tax=Lutibacter oricola TaxID=762486 RepID=A0A1H3FVV7_9FLAO|nr:glycoside hydrolase family 2 TIM barrel-domain containing protein [Lutibacter oricola]SDX94498.1 Glucanosyltransferase [Lutibacter oricola]
MKLFKLILLTVFSLFISCENKNEGDKISISNRMLLVNDEQFLIKGICYHPVPKGSNQLDFGTIDQDLALMVEAGINTIRVYAPIDDETVLDKISNSGIKLIVGFGYNQDGNFDILSGSFIDYIDKYKNHKAILMWELGNEYNYHPEWFDGDIKNWYKAMNNAAELIKKHDSNHPTTTAHGDLPDSLALSLSNNIDVWGMNVYRWDNPSTIFSEWEKVSTKPMYLSEAGGDSYMTISKAGYEIGENQKAQADANAKILDAVFNNTEIGSGVTLFSFTDGWWKAGNNNVQDTGGHAPNSSGVPYDGSPNEEYWGMVDIDRNKKLTFDIIQQKYKNKIYENK